MALKNVDLAEYVRLLASIKSKIRSAQIKASVIVNKTLLALYWDIGKMIIEKQAEAKWGDFLIEKLAVDLRGEFPNMKGFSRRNLFYIRQWVQFYSGKSQFVQQPVAQIKKVQQLVGQIPWGHNILVISKVKSFAEAEFYLKETITHNWSRSVLALHMEANDFRRMADVPPFNQDALITALRTDQSGLSTFPEFLESSWKAGVVKYDVDFIERSCTYYGVNDEKYVEAYPEVKI